MKLLDITDAFEYTHMPFVSTEEIPQKLFLFCLQLNGIWKIHYAENDGVVHRLNTGLSDATYECAPVAIRTDNSWKVSFIAGNSLEHKELALYVQDINTDSVAHYILHGLHAGCYYSDKYTCYSRYGGIFYAKNRWHPMTYKINDARTILCIRPGPKGGFIISYDKGAADIVTLYILLNSNKVYKLTDKEGVSLYKACFHIDRWYYAKKIGTEFEERKIYEITDPVMEELDFDTVIEVGDYVSSSDPTHTRNRSIQDILFELPKDLR